MAYPSVTYTITDGTVLHAEHFNVNYADMTAAMSDGSKDMKVSTLMSSSGSYKDSSVTENTLISGRLNIHVDGTNANLNADSSAMVTGSIYSEDAWTDWYARSSLTGWTTYDRTDIFYRKVGKRVDMRIWIDGTVNNDTAAGESNPDFRLPYRADPNWSPRTSIQAIDDGTNTANYDYISIVSVGGDKASLYSSWNGYSWTSDRESNAKGWPGNGTFWWLGDATSGAVGGYYELATTAPTGDSTWSVNINDASGTVQVAAFVSEPIGDSTLWHSPYGPVNEFDCGIEWAVANDSSPAYQGGGINKNYLYYGMYVRTSDGTEVQLAYAGANDEMESFEWSRFWYWRHQNFTVQPTDRFVGKYFAKTDNTNSVRISIYNCISGDATSYFQPQYTVDWSNPPKTPMWIGDATSDIATYYEMPTTRPYYSAADGTRTVYINDASGLTLLGAWATPPLGKTQSYASASNPYSMSCYMDSTPYYGSGTGTNKHHAYWKFYKRDSLGDETLMADTTVSEAPIYHGAPLGYAQYSASYQPTVGTALQTTDRIVAKCYVSTDYTGSVRISAYGANAASGGSLPISNPYNIRRLVRGNFSYMAE